MSSLFSTDTDVHVALEAGYHPVTTSAPPPYDDIEMPEHFPGGSASKVTADGSQAMTSGLSPPQLSGVQDPPCDPEQQATCPESDAVVSSHSHIIC